MFCKFPEGCFDNQVSSLYISFGGGAPGGDIDNDGVAPGLGAEKCQAGKNNIDSAKEWQKDPAFC